MSEQAISLEYNNPILLWGPQNENFEIIKKRFPKLKLVARGIETKVLGDPQEILLFEAFFKKLIDHIDIYQQLKPEDLDELLGSFSARIRASGDGQAPENNHDQDATKVTDGVNTSQQTNTSEQAKSGEAERVPKGLGEPIVYGPNGLVVRARTPNQKKMVESLQKNDILFAIGPAGTGKTYTAVALAVRALRNKEVKRIILTRPAVEAGENLGFLPGDLKEKIDPYLRPLYDALDDMIPSEKLKTFLENRTIEVAPLAFMRGRTLDNCFVILDEAQNATDTQLKMFLTRMGPTAKFIITGDVTQIDLPKKQQSGLNNALNILENIEGIDRIFLSGGDVVRHKLVKRILKAYGDI